MTQIVIPMSGFGQRFKDAGYLDPKPLIKIEGKPIIHHVIDLFPSEKEFIFICNEFHLKNTSMQSIIKDYCPSAEIVSIKPHKKGPVHAVSQVFERIKNDDPVIVNYCDFTCVWDYSYFMKWVKSSNLDGCIPAYKGFHPHSLGKTNYAFIKENNLIMQEIQEKKPFTKNKINEFASSGTYFFSKGKYVKKYFQEVIKNNKSINNEFYCSLAYNFMVKDRLKVGIYELEHFMQWGTPEDFEEYKNWSNIFRSYIKKNNNKEKFKGFTLVPMAGKGTRFKNEGYQLPKPFIKINEEPMFIKAAQSLPKTDKYHFIYLSEISKKYNVEDQINKYFNDFSKSLVDTVPQGQAETCNFFIKNLNDDDQVTISACDHSVIFDEQKFAALLSNINTDIIVWTFRGHPPAALNPEHYGWIKQSKKSGLITNISVKKQLSDPKKDPIIIGTFTFKKSLYFKKAFQKLKEREGKVNGEFYVDSCIKDAIKLGYKCRIMEVEKFICWGTPNELKTFEYWQTCFHKWPEHPYNLENDRFNRISKKYLDNDFLKINNPKFLKK